jgi:hypothetical protein
MWRKLPACDSWRKRVGKQDAYPTFYYSRACLVCSEDHASKTSSSKAAKTTRHVVEVEFAASQQPLQHPKSHLRIVRDPSGPNVAGHTWNSVMSWTVDGS